MADQETVKSKKYVLSDQQRLEIEDLKEKCPKTLNELRDDKTDRLILVRMGNAVKGDIKTMQSLLGLHYSSTTYVNAVKAKNIRNEYFDGDIYDAAIKAIEHNSYDGVMEILNQMASGATPTIEKKTGVEQHRAFDIHTISINDIKIEKPQKRYFKLSEEAIDFIDGLDSSRISVSELVNFCILFVKDLIQQGKIEIRNSIGDLFNEKTK